MYAKYRLYLQTKRGSYAIAGSHTVNDLVALVEQWLERTSAGQSVYDDQIESVILYKLNPKLGSYVFSKRVPANSRQDVIRKVRELGGR